MTTTQKLAGNFFFELISAIACIHPHHGICLPESCAEADALTLLERAFGDNAIVIIEDVSCQTKSDHYSTAKLKKVNVCQWAGLLFIVVMLVLNTLISV